MSDKNQLSEFVLNAIREGRRIEALKRLRQEKGYGLKEAKELVDREIALNHADNPHYQTKPIKIPLPLVIGVVSVLTVGFCYWLALPDRPENSPTPDRESTGLVGF